MESGTDQVRLEQLGGEEGIRRWVTRFYEAVARHPLLAGMFDDLDTAREKQFAFFVEFFGGPSLYSEKYGKPFLRYKHRQFKIGEPERAAWMELVMEALGGETGDEAVLAEVERRLGRLAEIIVNHRPQQQDARYFNP